MSIKHIEADQLSRLEARTRFVKAAVRIFAVLFCMSLGFVVVATAVPQRSELKRLEEKVAEATERERVALADKEHKQIELKALREDPEYLELQARDRLDMYREGERVLRFRRDR